MKIFIDVAHCSLTKYGEELCGDKVEIVKLPQCTIIVLADGLGSGVKANILATLTTKISATMLKEGADIYETLDTIASTLPVCKEREIAYSTFTLIKISNEGKVYMAEYDNPKAFILSGKEEKNIGKKKLIINNRKIYESTFNVKPGDSITIVSDGIIHAGLGNTMNFGWTWDNVLNYIQRNIENKNDAHSIAKDLVEVCWDLYGHKPGDDATVVNIKIKRPEYVDLFTGPPKNREKDEEIISKFINNREGKKIICGGTAANIASRELGKKLIVDLDSFSEDIPPIAFMEGFDLITEGVITLNKTIEIIKEYKKSLSFPGKYYEVSKEDGASKLAHILLHECTHLNIWSGKAVNPAHQNPDLPVDLGIKLKLVKELKELLKSLGKEVNLIEF